MNLSITNVETGLHYNIFTCPAPITEEANHAYQRGQRSGVIYGNGDRWEWHDESLGEQPDVRLEFERGGRVVETYSIPWQSWEAFKIVSSRQGKTGKEYLALLLATGMAEGDTVGEMIHWLFSVPEPAPSQEITRFEQAQEEFHGEIPTRQLPDGMEWSDLL